LQTLDQFAITRKWPAAHPDRIQLYSLPTPNGVKASIMLEETQLPYEPHLVRFEANDQLSPEFISLNPNNKIPAIIDPRGPDGAPLGLFESGAILLYLAEKAGAFLPRTTRISGRGIGTWPSPSGFWPSLTGASRSGHGSWVIRTPSRISRRSLGSTTSSPKRDQ
jgi:hypothetical protein